MNAPRTDAALPPLRLISIAWGDSYVSDYLEYCLPAILAAGNLSALVSHFSCEVVLVTESRYFEQVKQHASYIAATKLCPVRLVRIDDLVVNRGSYGMSVTYGLFRGFEDLGPSMTECVLVFLNADFIIAEHSLGSLVPHLLRGERLLYAPSYCTIAEDVKPLLRAQRETQHPVLGISKRSMAKLILDNRHFTIRAKTVNQRFFHMPQTDQFYWAVSESALLGHQLPIAVVAMKPERYIKEPMTLWDYGLIGEFCPSMRYVALSDSDEFLMMELRDRDTAKFDLRLGWPSADQIAKTTASIITDYTRKLGRIPLTLHSEDLPPDVDAHRSRLVAFVDDVYANLPAKLDSHLDHPQWTYHYPLFHKARAQLLAASHDLPMARTQASRRRRRQSADLEIAERVEALISLLAYKNYAHRNPHLRELVGMAETMRKAIAVMQAVDHVPVIKLRDASNPAPQTDPEQEPVPGFATRLSRRLFGSAPWYRPWHWMHSRSRLATALAAQLAQPDKRVLFLYSGTNVLQGVVKRAGVTASAPVEVIRDPESFCEELGNIPQFDCCIVEAEFCNLRHLFHIYETVRPLMKKGSHLLAVFLNNSRARVIPDPDMVRGALPACGPARIAYSGCWASVAALEVRLWVFAKLQSFFGGGNAAAHAMGLVLAAPLATLSSFLERRRTMENSQNPGRWVTAATVEIEVG